MALTGDNNYFEDFNVGDTLIHQRGRTITQMDNHMFTSLVMNTAELHFNQAMIDRNPDAFVGGKLLVYGGVVLAFTLGLASQDTSENALGEVEMDNGKHTNPVFHGDTIFAESTVLEKNDATTSRLRSRQVQAGGQKTGRHGAGGGNRSHRSRQTQIALSESAQ